MLVVSGLTLVTITPLTAAQIMLMIDRYLGGHFFDTQAGGSAVVWMHFFWIFGHPEVYVLVMPAFGIASEIIPVFSRKAIFGYPAMVAASVGIAFVSIGRVGAPHVHGGHDVGGQHLLRAVDDAGRDSDGDQDFQLGGDDLGREDSVRDADAVLHRVSVSVFDCGTDGDHAVGGAVELAAAQFLFCDCAFSLRAGGCDRLQHFCGAFYYWYPKVTGRMLSETLGKWHFWLFLIGFHITFDTMHFVGFLGMPRSIYTYEPDRGWNHLNLIISIGGMIQGIAVLIFAWNLVLSYFQGKVAGNDPWDAWTLEWAVPSPPPAYNFAVDPVVHSRRPLWDLKHPEDPDWRYEG